MKYSIFLASFAAASLLGNEAKIESRLDNASSTVRDIMAAPDKGIPQDLLDSAQCVVVVPGLKKGAVVVGGEYGRGFASCRTERGDWSSPAAVALEGGSLGLQIGGSESDIILLVMNRRGMDRLLGDKFTLGADATVAAGPVGRRVKASTDIRLTAEILSWSRARGLFAGVSVEGATLRPDSSTNRVLYGREISNREILESAALPVPEDAKPFVLTLSQSSRPRDQKLAQAGDRVSFGEDQIHFSTGQSTLPKSAERTLRDLANTLNHHPDWQILVEGYTDNVGSADFNKTLSQDRAMAVVNWLSNHGVDRSRLSVRGYGESKPLADNATDRGRAMNRRVEIVRT
jgi:lipid-binding SYLF domain-containing protein